MADTILYMKQTFKGNGCDGCDCDKTDPNEGQKIQFNMRDCDQVEQFARMVSSLQDREVKFHLAQDGQLIYLIIPCR